MATVVMNDWLGESGGREGGSQNSRATSDGDKRRARRKVSTPRSLGAFTGRPIHGRVEAASDTRAGLRPAFALRSEPALGAVSYTHLRAHETPEHLVCRLLL